MKKLKMIVKRLFCRHYYTGGVRLVEDRKGRLRHGYVCKRCGKVHYID